MPAPPDACGHQDVDAPLPENKGPGWVQDIPFVEASHVRSKVGVWGYGGGGASIDGNPDHWLWVCGGGGGGASSDGNRPLAVLELPFATLVAAAAGAAFSRDLLTICCPPCLSFAVDALCVFAGHWGGGSGAPGCVEVLAR